MRTLLTFVAVLGACMVTAVARAEPSRGDLRFSLDVDVIGINGMEIERDGGGPEREVSLFTVGNAATPASLGIGWALSSKMVIGARAGFGFAKEDYGDDGDATVKQTSFMIAPGLTFLPLGDETKLFLELSPILRIGHVSVGRSENTGVSGGAGLAVGMLVFASRGASVDLGFFFDATFGSATFETLGFEQDTDARTLRGGVRLGLSIWE